MTNFILFNSEIVTTANNEGWCFDKCLELASKCLSILEALKTADVTFTYKTIDGPLRKTKGRIFKKMEELQEQKNPLLVLYYDLEKIGIRSFRIENLLKAKHKVKINYAYSWISNQFRQIYHFFLQTQRNKYNKRKRRKALWGRKKTQSQSPKQNAS